MEERPLGGVAACLYAKRVKNSICDWLSDLPPIFGSRHDHFECDGVDGDDDAPAGDYFAAIQVNALRADGRLGVGDLNAAGQF